MYGILFNSPTLNFLQEIVSYIISYYFFEVSPFKAPLRDTPPISLLRKQNQPRDSSHDPVESANG